MGNPWGLHAGLLIPCTSRFVPFFLFPWVVGGGMGVGFMTGIYVIHGVPD